MRAKREAPNSRSSDRRSGPDGSARATRRAAADSAPSRRTRIRAGKTSAPNREARAPRSAPQTGPMPRPVDRPARPKNTSQAKARAKARKAKAPKVVRPKLTERLAARLASIDLRPRTLANKVPFVVLVISSLGVGLGLTLWLSTDAAERSYQLSHARERTRMLQQQKEALERDVREAESAPALAEAARKQGMIPTRDTAHLVQGPDGNWVVVGTPKPADGVPPPPLNTKLPEDPPPPPKPPVIPLEVPVRVTPGPGDPPPPARSGPEVLVRTPDGTATLGGGTHLPTQVGPQAPGPVPAPGVAGQAPVAPGQLPVPLGTLPGPVPAQNPVPFQVGTAPSVVLPGPPPAAATVPGLANVPQPAAVPPALAPLPTGGEQFGPVTTPIPTAPGAPR